MSNGGGLGLALLGGTLCPLEQGRDPDLLLERVSRPAAAIKLCAWCCSIDCKCTSPHDGNAVPPFFEAVMQHALVPKRPHRFTRTESRTPSSTLPAQEAT